MYKHVQSTYIFRPSLFVCFRVVRSSTFLLATPSVGHLLRLLSSRYMHNPPLLIITEAKRVYSRGRMYRLFAFTEIFKIYPGVTVVCYYTFLIVIHSVVKGYDLSRIFLESGFQYFCNLAYSKTGN